MTSRHGFAALLVVFLASGLSIAADPEDDVQGEAEKSKRSGLRVGPGELLPVPIPIVNPTIGNGLGLLLGYATPLSKNDEVSPPSILGVGGFYTDSGSWGAGLGGKFIFLENFIRISGGVGYFRVNFDFFGIGEEAGERGESVPISQEGVSAPLEVLFRTWRKLYVGPRGRLLTVDSTFDLSQLPPELELPPAISADTRSNVLGIAFEWNNKDYEYAPTRGNLGGFDVDFSNESWGSDFEFTKYQLDYNHYLRLRKDNPKHLIAVRGTACHATSGAPFYELCLIGTSDAIRGYPGGQYRDQASVTAQAEYRWNFKGRWSMAAFAGGFQVASSLSDLSDSAVLPSVGVGMRWLAAVESRVNIRVDYAWGRDSSAFYVAIGEAF